MVVVAVVVLVVVVLTTRPPLLLLLPPPPPLPPTHARVNIIPTTRRIFSLEVYEGRALLQLVDSQRFVRGREIWRAFHLLL